MDIDVIRECQRIARELRTRIARNKSAHINTARLLSDIQGLVDGYFRTDRPLFLKEAPAEGLLVEIDGLMQDLLRLAQVRSRKGRYIEVLSAIEKAWRDLEVKAIPLSKPLIGLPSQTERQSVLLTTLAKVCPPAASCYQQALLDLADDRRRSWRGTATELREALREVLDTLAPDKNLLESPGFKLEDGARHPTMKQKVRFILKSRQWSDAARTQVEEAASVIDEKVGGFVRSVYSGSSASVHSSRERKEVSSLLRFVELSLAEILEIEAQ